MLSTFRVTIQQTKLDAYVGDKLLDETERFLRKTHQLSRELDSFNPSLRKRAKRNFKTRSTIY